MRNVSIRAVESIDHPLLAVANDYPRRHTLPTHRHLRAQLLYSATGIMQVDTIDGTWTVPTRRAVLIPPGMDHAVRMDGVSTRSLYIAPKSAPWFPARCQVIDVSPLLHELLLAAVDVPVDHPPHGRDAAVLRLVLHEIQGLAPLPFDLPMPGAGPLLQRCQDFAATPTIVEPPCEWAAALGVSLRSFNRNFKAQTGLTFQRWRERTCILHAVRLLSTGATVTHTAGVLGYSTPASFSVMFTKHVGSNPLSFRQAPMQLSQTPG